MLLVKTQIGPSKIDGIGLFAAQFIPEGTVIWKFVPGFDLELSEDDILQLSESAQEQALKYSYFDEKIKKYVLCSDDARFFNHSRHANTGDGESQDEHGLTIAVVDIREGEEMTCDYEAFDGRYKRHFEECSDTPIP